MVLTVVWFVVGLLFLIKGGDWFVDGAVGIARRLNIPELIIGATIVSIGTTLPEVMVSAASAVSGHGEIAYGNALGSIICNTALIAAVTIAVQPPKVDKQTLKLPVLFFFIAAVFYALNAYAFGTFSRASGIVLLVLFVVYLAISVHRALTPASGKTKPRQKMPEAAKEDDTAAAGPSNDFDTAGGTAAGSLDPAGAAGPDSAAAASSVSKNVKKEVSAAAGEVSETAGEESGSSVGKEILLLIAGALLIAVGANLLVDNGTLIAQGLGVPESVIALTFVALGTSLPELVTAVTSLMKGHGALSLGNVIGANLFNLVLVCGISISLSPFAVPSSKQIFGLNSSLVVDIPLVFLVMAFLTLPAIKREKLSRWQGITLLIVYAAFCVYQFAF